MHGPSCPIYGFGAIFVILMLSWLDNYPLLVFILGIIITSLIEYFTSWLLEMLFHIMWWDYSQRKFNINGRVCLRNSFLFGCMSIFVIYFLHPSVSSFVGSISIFTASAYCYRIISLFSHGYHLINTPADFLQTAIICI